MLLMMQKSLDSPDTQMSFGAKNIQLSHDKNHLSHPFREASFFRTTTRIMKHFSQGNLNLNLDLPLLPWNLRWNLKMEVWKMIFLFRWVLFRFHVEFQGCSYWKTSCCSFPSTLPLKPAIQLPKKMARIPMVFQVLYWEMCVPTPRVMYVDVGRSAPPTSTGAMLATAGGPKRGWPGALRLFFGHQNRRNVGNNEKIHPWKIHILHMSSWRFGSDDFSFLKGDL